MEIEHLTQPSRPAVHDRLHGPYPERNNNSQCTTAAPTYQRLPLDRGLQWGSDPNFCYHGFSCPIGSWTEERLVRNAMRNMAYMATSIKEELDLDWNISNYIYDYNHLDQPPNGIRLNGFDLSSPSPERPDSHPSPTSSSVSSSSPSTSAASPERRETEDTQSSKMNKVRKCVQKPGQKLCHCRSEKKRREAVSRGYRELAQAVPGLEGQSFTRKYILNATARYLEELLGGNEALKRQLEQMEEQEVYEKDLPLEADGGVGGGGLIDPRVLISRML